MGTDLLSLSFSSTADTKGDLLLLEEERTAIFSNSQSRREIEEEDFFMLALCLSFSSPCSP